MAKKLMLAIDRKSWSLALKATAFAVAWFVLAPITTSWTKATFVVFLALLLYSLSLLRIKEMFATFLVFLGLVFLLPYSLWTALYIGVVFWALLGIKELWVIDRRRGMTTLTILLIFPFILTLFNSFPSWGEGVFWWMAFVVFGIFTLLAFIAFRQHKERLFPRRRAFLVALFSGFLFWQISVAVTILPLDPYMQVVLLFAWGAVFLTAGSEYMSAPNNALSFAGDITREKLFLYGSFAGIVTLLILATLP